MDEQFIQASKDALERYKNTGSDLTKEMTIEFLLRVKAIISLILLKI